MTPCRPLLDLHAHHYICDLKGRHLNTNNNWRGDSDRLTVSIGQSAVFTAFSADEKKNAEIKAHTLFYYGRRLFAQIEDALQKGYFSYYASNLGYCPDALQNQLVQHYALHPRGFFARRQMVQTFLDETIDALKAGLPASFLEEARYYTEPSTPTETLFATLPEWMQTLLDYHGCCVLYSYEHTEQHARAGSCPHSCVTPFFIYLMPILAQQPLSEQQDLFFEELMHALDQHARLSAGEFKNKYQWALQGMKVPVKNTVSMIRNGNEDGEALSLIRKTEEYGGSLMLGVARSEDYLGRELLVDLCQADKYLRHTEGLSAQGTKAELQRVFGEDTYAGYRAIIRALVEEAALIKAAQPGARSAEHYQQLWLHDPFRESSQRREGVGR